ncbi:MAG: hypothetical protein R6V60_02940 [Desulfobacterales bacterium]|jgi:hypothetical protein
MGTLRVFYAISAIAYFVSSAALAADLTGSWKGQLTATDGSTSDVQVDFSPQGYPLYSYTNNQGVTRQVELSQIGQTIEYVPQGGGVQRVVVKTMEGGSGRLSIGMVGSFERTSNGYMDQQQQAALFEYALAQGGLAMRLTIESSSHFGDKDGMVGGSPDAVVAEGVLQRVK